MTKVNVHVDLKNDTLSQKHVTIFRPNFETIWDSCLLCLNLFVKFKNIWDKCIKKLLPKRSTTHLIVSLGYKASADDVKRKWEEGGYAPCGEAGNKLDLHFFFLQLWKTIGIGHHGLKHPELRR